MNHTGQRSNTGRKHRPKTIEKPWLNSEGYFDPTAYLAIRNVENQNRKKELVSGRPPVRIVTT